MCDAFHFPWIFTKFTFKNHLIVKVMSPPSLKYNPHNSSTYNAKLFKKYLLEHSETNYPIEID